MNARYYLPGTGRFLSADTIVPNPTNPQSFNRYSYVRNNPINRVDPSGHIDVDCPDDCTSAAPPANGRPPTPLVSFTGVEDWINAEKRVIRQGALDYAAYLVDEVNQAFASSRWARIDSNMVSPVTARQAFLFIFQGSITFNKTGTRCPSPLGCLGQSVGNNVINVYTNIYNGNGRSIIPNRSTGSKWAVHEIFHVFEGKVNSIAGTYFARNQLGNHPSFDTLLGRAADNGLYGFAGLRYGWQQSPSGDPGEILADMQIGLTYNQWESDSPRAAARRTFMNYHPPKWISLIVNSQ